LEFKEQLGHASIQTTVDVYGHLAPGSNRNAVNKLDDDETPPLRLASAAG
jgi:integrase